MTTGVAKEVQVHPPPPADKVHPQLTMCSPTTDNVEVTVDEEEKCESTNIYSGVTASSREGRKLKKQKQRSLGAPPRKNPGYDYDNDTDSIQAAK
jgi:hypothetical protein